MKVDEILKRRLIIRCETIEESKRICNIFHQNGLKWCNGSSYLDFTFWGQYQNNTLYLIYEGSYGDYNRYGDDIAYDRIIPSLAVESN